MCAKLFFSEMYLRPGLVQDLKSKLEGLGLRDAEYWNNATIILFYNVSLGWQARKAVAVARDLRRRRENQPIRSKMQFGFAHTCMSGEVTNGYNTASEGTEGNKNRLSSTTCGEELQKIGKDWQSFKGRFQAICVFDLF